MKNANTRARLSICAALFALTLSHCDCLRPEGKTKLELDEENLVSIDPGWFVFGGQPACHIEQCEASGWSTAASEDDAIPWRLTYLTGYRIERREVTNAEYHECVQHGVCGLPDNCYAGPPFGEISAGIAPDACAYVRDEVAYEPVRHVTWLDARKFCNWRYSSLGLEADLPTEAQWERAAVGPAQDGVPFAQPALPMTDVDTLADLTCETIVHAVGRSCVHDNAMPDNPVYDDEPHPFAIFSYDGELALQRQDSKSVEGLTDMAGNVAEWVLDASDDEGALNCGVDPATQAPVNYLGADFSVEPRTDCYPSSYDLSCNGNRVGDPDDVAIERLCNPMQGNPRDRFNDDPARLETADINAEHIYKGGSYTTKNWCDLSPRARRAKLDPGKNIGFRCAVWDDAADVREQTCTAGSLPPSPQAAAPDAGLEPDAAMPDSALPDAAMPDAAAPDASAEDA